MCSEFCNVRVHEIDLGRARAGLIAITMRHSSGLSRLISSAIYLPAPVPKEALWRSMTVMRNLIGRRFGFRLEMASQSLTMGVPRSRKGQGKQVVIPLERKYSSLLQAIALQPQWLSVMLYRSRLEDTLRKLVGDDEEAVWKLIWKHSGRNSTSFSSAPQDSTQIASFTAARKTSMRNSMGKKSKFGSVFQARK